MIFVSKHFKAQIKPLAKKHNDLIDNVAFILDNFSDTKHLNIGHNIYKIRINSKNLNKGKNKSFRLIVLLVKNDNLILPLTIYFKGNKGTITNKEITKHIKIVYTEINNI